MSVSKWWWTVMPLLALFFNLSDACSCMMQHPQTHYCQADFVIVATARRLMKFTPQFENIYKLKIRKEFKMSEKAKVALKAGRIKTSSDEGLCGVTMRLNQTYLITGRVRSLEAHVNLCNFVQPWKEVTPRQRKGFRMLYKQGCPCSILPYTSFNRSTKRAKHICRWENQYRGCYGSHGICLINKDGLCHWARAPKLNECMRQNDLPQMTFH